MSGKLVDINSQSQDESGSTSDKQLSKGELLREYLEEFFEGKIMSARSCGISYKEMQECFFKDT
jgi:hypothetical protein